MRQSRTIADQALLTLITRIGALGLGVISALVMARALGATGRGEVAVVLAVVTLAQYVSAQALSHGQFRLWSRKSAPENVVISAGAWLSLAAAVAAGAVICALYAVDLGSLLDAVEPVDLALLTFALPVWIHLILVRDTLIMRDRLMEANLALLTGEAVRCAGIVALAAFSTLTVETALAMVVAGIVVPWALMCRKVGITLRRPPLGIVREEAAVGAELAPAFFLQQLNLRVDVLFVSQFAGLEATGLYAVAVVISELAWVATDSLTYTVRARQASADERGAAEITARAARMNILLAFAVAVALAAAMPVVVVPLLGAEFSSTTAVVWALVLGTVAMAPWRTLTIMLVRLTRAWVVPLVSLGAVTVGVGLCWWWAGRWGAVGAGFACSAGYLVGALASGAVFCSVSGVRARQLLPGAADIREALSVVAARRRQAQLALGR